MKSFLSFFTLVTMLISCANNDASTPNSTNVPTASAPILSYQQTAVYPHDTSSYTQGLELHNGMLYESTGNYGFSKLLRVNIKDGKADKAVSLPNELFGEGLTIMGDTVFQLTWKEKKVLYYNKNDFRKLGEFELNTEGWGLTNDGTNLIVTDGSGNLYYHDPRAFRLLRTQGITEGGSPAFNLNELEWVNGFIYANQYGYPYIFKIDPALGQVVAKLDFTDLINRLKSKAPYIKEMNGIAYDSANKKMYVTGKWWPELYEISFDF